MLKKCKRIQNRASNDVDALDTAENNYLNAKNYCNKLVRKSKKLYFQEHINDNVKNSKKLWASLKQLGVIAPNADINTYNPDINDLNNFFVSNNNLVFNQSLIDSEIEKISQSSYYPSFILQHVTVEDIAKAFSSISTNAQGVDSINMRMLSFCMPFCLSHITYIINTSISSNTYPSLWKKAHIKHIPKIKCPSALKDYRPISILPTISKILEKVVSLQVCRYLDNHRLHNFYQSGFRKKHSTATALLKVVTDIIDAIDRNEITFLTLLDYSKAFDTVNHRLLMAKLKYLGFMEQTLAWFRSYLIDRSQRVIGEEEFSSWLMVSNGVPQGSILGPLLFIILTSDLNSDVTSSSYHMYADDTQIYAHCLAENIAVSVSQFNTDLNRISSWSQSNALKLNASKSKVIIIGSSYQIKSLSNNNTIPDVAINNDIIPVVSECRNLGILFDNTLSWLPHINSLISKSYGKLRSLNHYKHFLSSTVKLKLCDSLILSNFNYCDFLFGNLTAGLQQRVQRVQNSCLRYAFDIKKSYHITPFLYKSRWLNMSNRRLYHSLCFIFKIINGDAPPYFDNYIIRSGISHQYSTRLNTLTVPPHRLQIKQNSFFVKVIKEYNRLPQDIQSEYLQNI